MKHLPNILQHVSFFLMCSLLLVSSVYAGEDTTTFKKPQNNKLYQVGQNRDFKNVDEALNYDDFAQKDALIANPLDSGSLTEQARAYIRRARATMAQIKSSQAFTTITSVNQIASLPMGIHKKIGTTDYSIGIDSIVFTPSYSYVVAYMIIKNPQDGSELYFVAKNVRINQAGGFVGTAKLELMADYRFNLGGNPQSGTTQITFKAGKTFAEWDCGGFKRLSVDAEVLFSRDLLLVENNQGQIDSTQRVKGTFKAQMEDWSDLIATVNFTTPFQARRLKGVGFVVKEASLDLSEIHNPSSVNFPANYHSESATSIELWKGFYLKRAEVRLPRQFKKKNGVNTPVNPSDRITFITEDVLIDEYGFSGKITVLKLIAPKEGSMSKWSYSLDSLGITLTKNQLISAGFKGEIVLPIAKEETPLAYTCLIDPLNQEYVLSVKNREDLVFPLWGAGKVKIYENSLLEVKVVEGNFRPRALLNGNMTIEVGLKPGTSLSSSDKEKVKLADIDFEALEVKSVKPYVTVGNFSFGSDVNQVKVAGFPCSLENIEGKNYQNGIALEMDVVVNFVGKSAGSPPSASANSFGAEAHLVLLGEPKDTTATLSYRFKGVEITRASIDIDQGAFSLKGELAFFKEDATYGNGFQGNLEARFPAVEKVRVSALFGTTLEGMRYWYADALLTLSTGIPLGAIEIKGFTGGAYYQMKQAPQGQTASSSGLGTTPSGISYVPDEKTHFGIRAGIEINTAKSPQAFNGSVTLEVAFFKTGGVSRVMLSGEGNFVTPAFSFGVDKLKAKAAKIARYAGDLDVAMGKIPGTNFQPEAVKRINESIHKLEGAENAQGAVRATVMIDYDVAAKTLHGNFQIFVNVAGGLIQGIGANGMAGEAVFHVAPSKWYIHLGNPSQRMGLQLAGLARTGSYLMVGHDIPDIPAPPDEVSSILGQMNLALGRDMSSLSDGRGFAMGMDVKVDTGDLTFLVFYARFAAGLGFDIMMKNYGEEAVCVETQQRVGINGWYAMGQAYAFVMGKIGIKVDLPFFKGKVDILDIAAAAILQAKLPNPAWFRGIVGGRFNILGGLVKGSCKFEMTIGKQCTIQNANLLAGMQIISQLTPENEATGLDVFTSPQAVFNYEIGKEFELSDPETGRLRIFRVKLEKFEIVANGAVIPASLEWDSDKKTAALVSHDILPSEAQVNVLCRVSFEEYIGTSWKGVISGGKLVTEEKTASFKTGKAPDYIPLSNVAWSYPVANQLYYHPKQTREAYIKLKRGQPDLFVAKDEWNQEVRVKTGSAATLKAGFVYDNASKEIRFSMPEGVLTSKVYTWEIVNTPAYARDSINSNVSQVTTTTGTTDNNIQLTGQQATGSLVQLQDKAIFTAYFASSKYNTFKEKIASLRMSQGWSYPVLTGVHEIGVNISAVELFDKAEILGNEQNGVQSLVQMEAEYNTYWHNSLLHPIVYEGLPHPNISILNRVPAIFGVPPTKDIIIGQNPNSQVLSASDATAGIVPLSPTFGSFVYRMAISGFNDYTDLRTQAAQVGYSANGNAWINRLLTEPYPTIQSGDYPVRIRYVLPGKNQVIAEERFIINRP
ncbi:hypothetical protein AD998_20345 [bacterium 336/3]|nr:hypothetical protein AD998_20345 [bacterium 336/3]